MARIRGVGLINIFKGSYKLRVVNNRLVMGHNATKFSHLVAEVAEDNHEITRVQVESVQLSEKAVKKLGDALRTNR